MCFVAQSCLTLCDLLDCSPPGSSIHGISQVKILGQLAISFSRGSSWPRDQICVSFTTCIGRQVFPPSTTWEKWPSCSSFSFYIIVIIIIPFIENLLCARYFGWLKFFILYLILSSPQVNEVGTILISILQEKKLSFSAQDHVPRK